MTPAEVFHVWEYIDEEMKARGMTFHTLAVAMGGNAEVNLLTLYLISCRDTRAILDRQTSEQLSKAFFGPGHGTGSDYWVNLDVAWRKANDLPVVN